MPEAPPDLASSPCFAPFFEDEEAIDGADVSRWRKRERERLIAERLTTPVAEREAAARKVVSALEAFFGELDEINQIAPGTVVSAYWPFRGEIDLRAWLSGAVEAGRFRAALPVVVAKGAPLLFREWRPGAPLERGVWNIPVPADGAELRPDIVIAPLVGFDRGCYRLGYGGGFFDRTLAALPVRPLVIGVGLPASEIQTIYPQRYDVPMDVIVTGDGPALRRKT